MINRFSIFLLAFLLFGTVHAAEVYTFVDQHCKIETGFIIDTDEDRVQLLNLDGKSSFIDKDSVRFVLSYDILENPIPRLYPSEQLNKKFYAC